MPPDIKYQLQEAQYGTEGGYHRERLSQQTALGTETRAKLQLTTDVIESFHPAFVLDLGSGEGVVMEELAARGIPSVGVELSPIAIPLMPAHLQRSAIQGDISKLPLHSASVPLATMIAVLEHIPPPDIPTVLQEIHRVLEDDGLFVVRVPSTLQVIKDKHFQHFTPDSLKATLEQRGLFNIEGMIGNHHALIDWPYYYELILKQAGNKDLGTKNIAKRAEEIYDSEVKICDPEYAKRLLVVCRKN